ncbi:superoxide dismutase family protein [Hyphomicrobium methylovorum]|uniref:superoxide dismutase family protein n=1 Tax=Hyphomicrobium methylovorum TaxID=84 RepID=UPI0015E6C524|nr:superoxide dismutase family protein [Hyphomicrobium methylovorum]MBA2126099.1 superoxide dismutase family protein [Hyphomicrobium methylovorum]
MTVSHVQAALLIAATACFALAPLRASAESNTASATLKLVDGADAGTVKFMETSAGVLLKVELKGLKPGPHGFHVHSVGKCEGDFSSAGEIFNPLGAGHGFMNEEGPMAGDLPNVHAAADGTATAEMLSPFIHLRTDAEDALIDSDGAAIVVFANPDDYRTDPEGGAEPRVACGILKKD